MEPDGLVFFFRCPKISNINSIQETSVLFLYNFFTINDKRFIICANWVCSFLDEPLAPYFIFSLLFSNVKRKRGKMNRAKSSVEKNRLKIAENMYIATICFKLTGDVFLKNLELKYKKFFDLPIM